MITCKSKLVEVQKQIVREQKKLEKLTSKTAKLSTIEKQKLLIKALQEQEAELAEAPEEKAKVTQPEKGLLPFKLAGTDEIIHHKLARVRYNRPVKQKDVDDFIAIIANGEYEEAYPIIAAEARKLIEVGYEVVDYDGRVITKEEAPDYLAVLDGQHRCKAFAQLIAAGQDVVIPNTHVREVKNLGKYLIAINKAGRHWDKGDKFTIAQLTSGEEPFTSIAKRIAEGFNPSTPMLIYTGRRISESVLNKVLNGEPYKLNKKAVVDIARGDKFITLCKAAEMDVKLITKRYFIEGFNYHCASVGEEAAFKALEDLKNLPDKEARFKAVKDSTDFIELLADLKQ